MSEIILTDQNFSEEILKCRIPFLIDFWAEWCVPCQMVAPILQEISEEFGTKIKIGKLNVDKNPSISATLAIDALPTLMLFHNKKIVKQFIGVQPKEVIAHEISLIITSEKE